ncbi:hypothetical protein DY926_15015 [Komagataeibacter melaceti]|uniref:Uncharacterized protein n=1 Tax=Komagataeibacter melaceti TaxID=2766577 RepID=A0A371YWR1_9PROT|nr:hypothetical protein [Komagataeibacter melaceti]RFD18688.1 hypothetical protein DY926_15015 [Komagataeibacter melaceti]
MTDTTATSPTAQNYVLYRTQADGWQQVGYVIMAMTLPGPTAFTPPAGMALGLDAARAYPAGSIYPVPSTGYTLAGAATATAGTPLTLTLAPNNAGPQANTTVTLSDGGAGGTFSASTVTFDAGSTTAQTVTYTPKAAGTVAISATNNGGLTDPASLEVTVGAAAAS